MLNALRHQRCVQRREGSRIPWRGKCSTPYGIKGVSSDCCFLPPGGRGGAQRLTASKVCPVAAKHKHNLFAGMCSTPYGIKGVSSRHDLVCRTFCWRGAQRLTASKVCPGFFFYVPPQKLTVLNALQHQRCVQFCSHHLHHAANAVLNALRHQRCVQQVVVNGETINVCRCSTPYGIKGVSRSTTRNRAKNLTKVLNALRHQRCVQEGGLRKALGKIQVLNALWHQRCVQYRKQDTPLWVPVVLNALRHQRCVQSMRHSYS